MQVVQSLTVVAGATGSGHTAHFAGQAKQTAGAVVVATYKMKALLHFVHVSLRSAHYQQFTSVH